MRLAISFCMAFALAFTTNGAAADVQDRYAELQAVPEAINDPDPLMRLALLEAIVAEGDATKVQLALRTAFTVDDPNVRALALRAHLATYRTMVIQAEIPDGSEGGRNSISGFINALGQTFVVSISGDDITGTEFPIQTINSFSGRNPEQFSGSGNVRGSTITLRGVFWSGNNSRTCSFELHKYDGFVVSGEGSCDQTDGSFRFPVKTRLF